MTIKESITMETMNCQKAGFRQLIYKDLNKRFDIDMDTSKSQIGVVINQSPSTAVNIKPQQRYVITEKEPPSIVKP